MPKRASSNFEKMKPNDLGRDLHWYPYDGRHGGEPHDDEIQDILDAVGLPLKDLHGRSCDALKRELILAERLVSRRAGIWPQSIFALGGAQVAA